MRRSGFTPLETKKTSSRNVRSLTGFTFIELIVSVAIFTVILVTVYSAFYMGIKTWHRSQTGRVQHRIRLTLMKIEKELKGSFFFSKIPFKGTHQEMIFPLSIPYGNIQRPYIITYSVDVKEDTGLSELTRKEKLYSEKIGEIGKEDEEIVKILLPLMKSIKFEYAHLSEDPSKDIEWHESWNGEEQGKLPTGIKVSLEMDDSGEAYNKVVFLQVDNLGAI